MTIQIHVAGPVTVKIDAGSGLETLGVCLDPPRIRDRAFYQDIHGDMHGGAAGPPLDVQYLGRLIHVRMELSKYDAAVANKLRARLPGAAAGTVSDNDIGALLLQDDLALRILLDTPNQPYNFLRCAATEPIETTIGVKYSTLLFEFTAHRDPSSGVIYNAETS